jgi:RNA polymerase sigma-70 factor (ECF subfamily)
MAAPHSLTAIGTDPDALEAFYREHVEAVQRFVARRVSDPHLAADLTADVFLEAIESAAGYRSDLGPPRAWLFGVARNVLAMHVRRGIREARAVGRIQGRRLLDPDSVQRIVERIDAERDARELLVALDDLEDGLRAVVELVAVDGLTPAEAAAALGLTPVAVRVRLHRARRRLAAFRPTTPTPEEVPS